QTHGRPRRARRRAKRLFGHERHGRSDGRRGGGGGAARTRRGHAMATPDTADLTEAMKAEVRQASEKLHRRHPTERFYAFGVYTTELGSYFVPFACGEDGLRKVAARYVADGSYADLDTAAKELRWSIPDSPYHNEATKHGRHIEQFLKKRSDPY